LQGQHPLADLAPRDVVSRAIIRRMRETGTDHVYLDCRHLGGEFLEQRFPSIVERCRELDFDPATQLLPVAPAQHYASGGIRTDLQGRSSLEGLYACGETSCTGVHGANRLASNSLLEGLVFARRIADDLTTRLGAGELPETTPAETDGRPELVRGKRRLDVQRAMTAGAGSVRSAESLAATQATLAAITERAATAYPDRQGGPKSWETTNLLHLGQALTYAATLREETRGGHVREDFPARDDERFLHHVHLRRSEDGVLAADVVPVPRSNLDGLDLDHLVAETAVARDDSRMEGHR
jgi:L-aspartate oxidase